MTINNETIPATGWFPYLKEKALPTFDFNNFFVETFEVKMFLSVILGVTMLLSLVGNVCTCVVIARDRSMWTPTNCYLLNLAVTDLITALYIPVEVYILWRPHSYPLGELGCHSHFILWDILSNCSVLTIVAFTVERYLVVSRPFLRQKLNLMSRVYKIIAINWLISILFCIPDVFYIQLFVEKGQFYCTFIVTDVFNIILPMEMILFFMIPMTVITVLYILIAIKLNSKKLKLRSRSAMLNQNRDKAVKLLAAVAASFFLCWAPYCILRMMLIGPRYFLLQHYNTWRVVCCICGMNICISTAVNPILYSLMSRKFRQAFKAILKGQNPSQRSRRMSTLHSINN